MNPKEFGHCFLASFKDHTVGVSFHIDKTFKTSFGLVSMCPYERPMDLCLSQNKEAHKISFAGSL